LHGLHERPQSGESTNLDEEADDPEDPPRPNTFLARAVEAAEEEEGGDGDVVNFGAIQKRRWCNC
ncbi:hypothetical protein Taro_045973, partial [Colocasia esculenta]|nr:hypothetical protein [Colocasia esculenta]